MKGADGRILFPVDRRRYERRTELFPLQSREMRLQLAIRIAGIGTCDLDCQSGDIYCSAEFKAMAGLPEDDSPLSLKAIGNLVHPEDKERVWSKVESALEPRETLEFEECFRLLRPDGTLRWVKARGRTFFAGSGEQRRAIGATGIVMDVSDSHGAPPEGSEAELEALVEAAQEAIVSIDGELRILRFNPAACRMFRCQQQAAIGARLDRFLAEAGLAFCRRALKKGFSPGSQSAFPVFLARRADGEAFSVEASLAPVGTGKGRRLTLSMQDISQRLEYEAMLGRLRQQLEQQPDAYLAHSNEALENSNRKLQQFAYIAAHDLQAPLRSIKGFALMLQNEFGGRLGPQGDTWISHLLRSTQRMQSLIHDLLAYSRVDSHGVDFQPTDLGQVVDDVVITLDAAIREAGAQVTRDELPVVLGDRSQLGQLLQNLVGNGIKYRSAWPPRIHVSARWEDECWIVSVRDNGIGIPAREIESIFELFRRLHSQQEYPGTGIGLAVCRRVVQRHGGLIWVESTPGAGSVFHFSLPHRRPEIS